MKIIPALEFRYDVPGIGQDYLDIQDRNSYSSPMNKQCLSKRGFPGIRYYRLCLQ